MAEFAQIPLDKWQWHPSPLAHQVVLVTSIDAEGTVDVAPKSNCTVIAFEPLTYGIGCQKDHLTYQNIAATREFIVNVPTIDQAGVIAAMADAPHEDRLALTGFTTTPGKTVGVAAIDQCVAHLECALDQVVEFGSGEVFIIGAVHLIEVDARCLVPAGTAERYEALGTPFVFLEPGWYAPIGQPVQAQDRSPSDRPGR